MPRRAIVPPKEVLQRWISEGLNRQQMADRIFEQTGDRVTPNAISVAMNRYGMDPVRPRYADVLPWEVQARHVGHRYARMLRLLGRRRAGGTLSPSETSQLDRFLVELEGANAVVAYVPDSPEGFYAVPREPEDKDVIRAEFDSAAR